MKNLVRLSFSYHATSINTVTDYATLVELKVDGLEVPADKYIEEIKQSSQSAVRVTVDKNCVIKVVLVKAN